MRAIPGLTRETADKFRKRGVIMEKVGGSIVPFTRTQ